MYISLNQLELIIIVVSLHCSYVSTWLDAKLLQLIQLNYDREPTYTL